ncbi:Type VII secretion-associated protein [Mycobacterium sp. IEC1808]|uniref:type VII secretion-associated protein n=1 Tax=Mycobacterium sp. IEC1808 TaxID=1743230 RepID=UPI000A169C42|nr:type VII secretion-associated protein [Mycobacterium sp. IEC1808]ORW98012.1 Type VII secretion-associated protein [Mycobacterium sp. IEC1808]
MSSHRALIEAGPGAIRRLCCGTAGASDEEMSEVAREALGAIDDRVALVGGRPVAVDSLWRAALRSLQCEKCDGLVLIHPAWWPSARVAVVTSSAKALTDEVLVRRRSWLLAQACDPEAVVVEIAERVVVITGPETVAIPRGADEHAVGEEAVVVIAGMARRTSVGVVIDAPGTVARAPELGRAIARALLDGGLAAVEIGSAQLALLAQSVFPLMADPTGPRVTAPAERPRPRARVTGALAGAVVALTAFPLAIAAAPPAARRGASPPVAAQTVPTTFLVEGRVALTVPAHWSAQRVVTGPGSARVKVTSPSDPEVALHVTQSTAAGETLGGAAERLRRAIDAEPAGVFVDFNPAGMSGGRPAVTYREVRVTHQVRWTVLLDGPVRISVGCQSRPGDEAAVHDACEQAVRTAHAIG